MQLSMKLNYIFILPIIILLLSIGVNCIRFSGSDDSRIRKCLLEGLKRFHLMAAPITADDPIAQRLSSFNPHFVFEDAQVNELMFQALEVHFKNSENLESHDTIHDELQLLIMKYIYSDLNFDLVPRNIYFYLIAFLNEALYGVDKAKVAIDRHMYAIDFLRKLTKYNLPVSYEYFYKLVQRQANSVSLIMGWPMHLEFFRGKPSKEAIKQFYGITDINTWNYSNKDFHACFLSVIYDALIDDFTDEKIANMFQYSRHWGLDSILERHFSAISEEKLILMPERKYSSSDENAIACTKLQERFGIDLDICHAFTRSTLQELSIDLLLSKPNNLKVFIGHFKGTGRYSLYDLEMFSILMNSNKITTVDRLFTLMSFISWYYYPVCEVLMKESTQPINFLTSKNLSMTESFDNRFYYPIEGLLDFLLKIDDPLIILSVHKAHLRQASQSIKEMNLDLNKIYRFEKMIKNGNALEKFMGRTMHFKQLIKELNDPEICGIFSSNPHEFDGDYTVIDESLPVTIINENFTFTLNPERA